ncbi:MAG: cobalt ECF transporter T component CbiQ [Methanolinea sp.]|nr:cobalt ECF transporter T component CbiQ [Methanolinea sp.]
MYEEILEDIAHNSALRETNTAVKLATGAGAILLCLLSPGFFAPLFVAVTLVLALVLLARVDIHTLLHVYMAPALFALFSIAVIVLVSGGGECFWRWQPLPWFALSLSRDGINQGVLVLARFAGGTTAIAFIALTTPMTDLFAVMKRARVPDEVTDLAMIIYRTIFVIMAHVVQVYRAQIMRLGYSTFRESVRSFATLCGAVFIASWEAGEDLVRAMEARCYDGKFAVLGRDRPPAPLSVAAVALFFLTTGALAVTTADITLI